MLTIQFANKDNFHPDSLDGFDRFQQVTNVYRLTDGTLRLEHRPFTEDWSAERKREKAREILSGDYVTLLALDDDRVVGELMLVPETDHGRLIVSSFHISGDCRRRGIGRMLFDAAKREACERGAHSLYVSACSSEETIRFYLAMGCRISEAPIAAYAEDEPSDIQMECTL